MRYVLNLFIPNKAPHLPLLHPTISLNCLDSVTRPGAATGARIKRAGAAVHDLPILKRLEVVAADCVTVQALMTSVLGAEQLPQRAGSQVALRAVVVDQRRRNRAALSLGCESVYRQHR